MKTKFTTSAIASFAVTLLVSGAAHAAMIAGWDMSQFFSSGELYINEPGITEGYTDFLPANYSNLLVAPGVGPGAATRGTLFFDGSNGSSVVLPGTTGAQVTPTSGSLLQNVTAPQTAAGYVPFGSVDFLNAAGQGFEEDLSLQIVNAVNFVFAAYLGPTSGSVNDWTLTFGGKTLGGSQEVNLAFSVDGVNFQPLGTRTLTTADDPATPFTVSAGVLPAGTDRGLFRFSFAGITGQDARIDNVAINGTVVPPVPEPATVVLLGAALAGFAVLGRRRSV